MFAADVPCTSYETHFSSAAFDATTSVLPACSDTELRSTVLPPVQSSECAGTSEGMEPSDVVAGLPPCDDDDSVPPLVRFKNRYRREQQLEEQQRRYCETVRDWNHNETSKIYEVKTNCSPVENRRTADDVYCSASSSKILPDSDAVSCNVYEKKFIKDEARSCEKRTRITSEADLSEDRWMSSSKIPCLDAVLDSRRVDLSRTLVQPENDTLPKQYQQTHEKSLEYPHYVVDCPQPKCETHTQQLLSLYFHIFITVTALAHNLLQQ